MKHILLLIISFLSIQLTAQTGMDKAIEISKRFSKFNIQSLTQGHTRSQLPKTHTLDSIVLTDDFGEVLGVGKVIYDNEGKTTLLTQYEQDSTGTSLIVTNTIAFEYDGGENPSAINLAFLGEDGELSEKLEFDIYYLADGKVDSFVLSQEDPFSGIFVELIAFKHLYDGDLLVETRNHFYFSFLGFWTQSGGTVYTYNSEDQLIEEVTYTLDFESFIIIPQSRILSSYNVADLRDTVLTYYYENDAWVLSDRTYHDYYATGLVENEIIQYYVNDAWENNSWYHHYQDVLVDEYDITYYFWTGGSWTKTDSTHDALIPTLLWENVYAPTQFSVVASDDLYLDFLRLNAPATDVRSYYIFDEVTGEIIGAEHETYYYSIFDPSAVIDALPDFISISPNPSSDYTYIKMDSDGKGIYTISSLSGQRISGGQLQKGTMQIPTSNIVPGMYIFLLQMEDGSAFMHRQVIK